MVLSGVLKMSIYIAHRYGLWRVRILCTPPLDELFQPYNLHLIQNFHISIAISLKEKKVKINYNRIRVWSAPIIDFNIKLTWFQLKVNQHEQ